LVKKTAAKKIVKPPREYIEDFEDAKRTLIDLELDIKRLKNKLNAFCQNPQIHFPPPPPPPKK
jgi:hypothetical protein